VWARMMAYDNFGGREDACAGRGRNSLMVLGRRDWDRCQNNQSRQRGGSAL